MPALSFVVLVLLKLCIRGLEGACHFFLESVSTSSAPLQRLVYIVLWFTLQ